MRRELMVTAIRYEAQRDLRHIDRDVDRVFVIALNQEA